MVFAATYPERTNGLVLYNTYARLCCAPDYPWGSEREARHEIAEMFKSTWGEPGCPLAELAAPSMVKDTVYQQAFARSCRLSFPPRAMMQMWELGADIDVRELLPVVTAPALVLSREGDVPVPCDHGRFLGEHLPRATFHLLPGADHFAHLMGEEAMRLIEEFVTGQTVTEHNIDRILASVLFTDIVGSTELAGAMGDKEWRKRLDRHDELIARQINRFDGKLIERSGDGTLATFDRPARAIACAQAIRDGVVGIDLQIRAGLHLGEVELRGDRIGGIAVHLAARIMSAAEGGEVFVSRTVKDVVAGSGVTFTPRGSHQLKGFDEPWELFSV